MADELKLQGVTEPPFSHLDLTIPKKTWVTVRGQLATGKRALIAKVVYGECQRRFLGTLPPYWQQQLASPPAPALERLTGAMPALLWPAANIAEDGERVADALGWHSAWRQLLTIKGSWQCPRHQKPVTASPSLTLPTGSEGRFAALCLPAIPSGELTAELVATCQKLGLVRLFAAGHLKPLTEPATADAKVQLVADIVAIKSAGQLAAACDAALATWSALIAAIEPSRGNPLWAQSKAVLLVEAFKNMTAAPFEPPLTATAAGHCPEPGCGFAVALVPETGADFVCAGTSYSYFSARRYRGQGLDLSYEDGLALPVAAAAPLLDGFGGGELAARQLRAAQTLGLDRLSLATPVAELSAGTRQRLALCSPSLCAASDYLLLLMYPSRYLDEAGIAGLGPRLEQLRERGNSLIVVDNHPALAAAAQHVLSLALSASNQPHTSWQRPKSPAPLAAGADWAWQKSFRTGAQERYLIEQPLPQLERLPLPLTGSLGICGPNGAGKSRLLTIVSERLKAAAIDNARDTPGLRLFAPMAAPQSVTTVASLLGIWQPLRALYSRLPEAKALGITAKDFLSAEYRCPVCLGGDALARAACDACLGSGLSHRLSGLRYRDQSLRQFLALPIAAAEPLVSRVPPLAAPLAIALKLPGLAQLPLATPVAKLSRGTILILQLAGFLAAGPRHKRVIVAYESAAFSHLHPSDREAVHNAIAAIVHNQGRGLVFTCPEPMPYHDAELWLRLGLVPGQTAPFMPPSCQFFQPNDTV